MIPIKADQEARDYYVRNIIDVWSQASPRQVIDGRDWYQRAHDLGTFLANGDVRKGAGVLAALSPQTDWWLNVELAWEAFQAGRAMRHLPDACAKANKILAGAPPESVLPMARKTGHFYRCILDPLDESAVCIDRHAHDVAVGVAYGSWPRGLSAGGRYDLLADSYRRAAGIIGVNPLTVQAVTWVAWREGTRFGSPFEGGRS